MPETDAARPPEKTADNALRVLLQADLCAVEADRDQVKTERLLMERAAEDGKLRAALLLFGVQCAAAFTCQDENMRRF